MTVYFSLIDELCRQMKLSRFLLQMQDRCGLCAGTAGGREGEHVALARLIPAGMTRAGVVLPLLFLLQSDHSRCS